MVGLKCWRGPGDKVPQANSLTRSGLCGEAFVKKCSNTRARELSHRFVENGFDVAVNAISSSGPDGAARFPDGESFRRPRCRRNQDRTAGWRSRTASASGPEKRLRLRTESLLACLQCEQTRNYT